MAKTANTGFSYYKSTRADAAAPIPELIRAGNSQTIRIGDLVRVNTDGLVLPAATGEAVAGVCVGIVDTNGINVLGFGYANGTGCTLTGDDTVTTASDNSSRASYIMIEVVLEITGENLWLNKADAALAQTRLFQFFDVATGRQVTVGSGSDTNGQVQLIALDPDATGGATADTTKGVFRIAENQFGLGIDSATAKNAA